MTEWDTRQLCPDGGCVGVIGPDGTCKVCGRVAPGWGDERQRGLLAPTDAEPDGDGDGLAGERSGPDDDGPVLAGVATSSDAEPEGWSERKLCSNGACIGVIGDDGRCSVCGTAA
jgi:hypothetical protein